MSAPTKKPVGRPAENLTGKPARYCVSLDQATADAARRLGGGNISNGIRIAVKQTEGNEK